MRNEYVCVPSVHLCGQNPSQQGYLLVNFKRKVRVTTFGYGSWRFATIQND